MSTDLGPLYLGDVYKQAARFGGQLDTTLRQMGDWFGTDTPIQAASDAAGVGGLIYFEPDEDSADNLSRLQAMDTGANSILCIVKPGTYVTSQWTITNLREVRLGPGVTFELADAADAGDAIFKAGRSGLVIRGCGKLSVLDANSAGQGTTANIRCIFSDGYSNVRVESLRVTGAHGRGVCLLNGDDLVIAEAWFDGCGGYGEDEGLYIARNSAGTSYRPAIINCKGTGYIAIEMSAAGGVLVNAIMATNQTSVAATDSRYIAFTSGGTTEIAVGNTITGDTSGATALVTTVTVDSGSWAAGDAAGSFIIRNQSGSFQAENLNVGASTNLATVTSNSVAAQPAQEMWSLETTGMLRPLFFNNQAIAESGVLAIGQSMARAYNGLMTNSQNFGFVLGLELADSPYSVMSHSIADCAGVTGIDGSTAISVDGLHEDMYHPKVSNCQGLGFTAYGCSVVGNSSTKPYNAVLDSVALSSTANGAVGFNIKNAPGTELINPQVRLTGTAVFPITFYDGSHRGRSRGGMSHMGAGATAGVHVRIIDSDYCDVEYPTCTHASGTLDTAGYIQNSTGSNLTGGYLLGTITNGGKLLADGSGETVSYCTIGGWKGDGGNISCDELNSGSIGDGNIALASPGYAPYSVPGAQLEEFHGQGDGSGYDVSRWITGIVGGDPNGNIPGLAGSRLLRPNAGIEYFNVDGSNTGWNTVTTA